MKKVWLGATCVHSIRFRKQQIHWELVHAAHHSLNTELSIAKNGARETVVNDARSQL